MTETLRVYVVVYERVDGTVSCEDSGICLSTATARAKDCADALLHEGKWDEKEQVWVSTIGNRVAVRPVTFTWEAIRDGR